MKIRFSKWLVMMALLPVSHSYAGILTSQEALKRVLNSTRSGIVESADYTMVQSLATSEGDPAIYIFTDGGSSLIVSAESDTPALLGKLDRNMTSATDNAEFRYWIGKYVAQIEWQRKNTLSSIASNTTTFENIQPLLTTRWGQGSPFNDLSPVVNGTRSWSGCVATAMSQVMNYHEWPERGVGSHTYKAQAANKTLSCDFSSMTFDWGNMADDYTSENSEVKRKAVSDLLYACAVSVDMDFSPDGSGAWSENVPGALVSYFNYDKGLHTMYRDYYTQSQWEEIVYDQLKNVGPVYYAGVSDDGAHAFVCDGYSDGYFHINWGWDGSLDGYYLLSALFPGTQQGAGGSTGAYNFDQFICAGVQPPVEGSSMVPVLLYPWGYSFEQPTVTLNSNVTVNGWAMNYSTKTLNGKLGIIVENSNGDKLTGNGFGSDSNYSKAPVDGIWSYQASLPEGIEEGEYVVYPAFQPSGSDEWMRIPSKNGFPDSYIMKVSGMFATFTPESLARISIGECELASPAYKGKNIRINSEVSNATDMDYEGVIRLSVVNLNNKEVASGRRMYVWVPSGESVELYYESRLLTDLPAGNYRMGFVNATTGEWISQQLPLKYEQLPETSVTLSKFYLSGDMNDIDPDNLEFVLQIVCSKGYFMDSFDLTLWTWPEYGDMQYIATFNTGELEIKEGESATVTVKGNLPDPETGMRYIVGAWYGGKQYGDAVSFIFKSSGIESVQEEDIVRRDYYNMSGVHVLSEDGGTKDLSILPEGIYIVRETYSSGKTAARRIMVK